MKRAFLRKVKPLSCSHTVNDTLAGEPVQAIAEVKRKTRTSAAMVGLALSMGATGLLIPRQDDRAIASEPQSPEASPSSVSHLATLPTEAEFAATTVPSEETIEHRVRSGQTLQQIAERYKVNIQDLASANNLSITASLRVGQVLKVPVTSAEAAKLAAAKSPQLVASANLNRLPISAETAQTQAQRNQALSRLEQQRTKLKNSLAELRRAEVSHSVATAIPADKEAASQSTNPAPFVADMPVAAPVSPSPFPSVAVLPSPTAASSVAEPDWMRVNQSLLVPNVETQSASPSVLPRANVPAANELAVRPTSVLPEASSLPSGSPQIDVPAQTEVSYRVNPGDTVARIARAHNISQSTLIAENRLSDPNVIFVGQVLQLPATSAPSVEVKTAQSLPSVVPSSTASNSGALPGVPTPVQASSAPAVAVVPSSLQSPDTIAPAFPTELNPSGNEFRPNSVSAEQNPYVQNLLSEVRALREKRVQPSAELAQPVEVAAANVSASSTGLQSAAQLGTGTIDIPEAVRVPARSIATPSQSPAPASTPTVVAAAPLGSENYAPLMQPVTGRMVSPELPSLPEADLFLPNGALRGYIWPAQGLLTSGYGWRWGRMHQGIDIAADIGTPIFAAASGVIEYAGWNSGGYGNMVEIRHSDGSMTRYAHLNAIYVQEGQRVSQSEQIAEMGSTGYSTGPHLHFEVHPKGTGAVNPMAFLPDR